MPPLKSIVPSRSVEDGLNGIFIGIFAVQKIMSFYIIFKIREKNMLAIKNDL